MRSLFLSFKLVTAYLLFVGQPIWAKVSGQPVIGDSAAISHESVLELSPIDKINATQFQIEFLKSRLETIASSGNIEKVLSFISELESGSISFRFDSNKSELKDEEGGHLTSLCIQNYATSSIPED